MTYRAALTALLVLMAALPASAHRRHHRHHRHHPHHHRHGRHRHHAPRATYYTRRDSNPHLRDGTWYGDHGFHFASVPLCRAGSLVSRGGRVVRQAVLEVVNLRNGRVDRHVIARDAGAFPARDIDLSEGESRFLNGTADTFPVRWRVVGWIRRPASEHERHRREARAERHERHHRNRHGRGFHW